MIPRALSRLVTDALTNGWSVHLVPYPTVQEVHAEFELRGVLTVEMDWADGRITYTEINGTPTPYTQCTRLIRSPEGATS